MFDGLARLVGHLGNTEERRTKERDRLTSVLAEAESAASLGVAERTLYDFQVRVRRSPTLQLLADLVEQSETIYAGKVAQQVFSAEGLSIEGEESRPTKDKIRAYLAAKRKKAFVPRDQNKTQTLVREQSNRLLERVVRELETSPEELDILGIIERVKGMVCTYTRAFSFPGPTVTYNGITDLPDIIAYHIAIDRTSNSIHKLLETASLQQIGTADYQARVQEKIELLNTLYHQKGIDERDRRALKNIREEFAKAKDRPTAYVHKFEALKRQFNNICLSPKSHRDPEREAKQKLGQYIAMAKQEPDLLGVDPVQLKKEGDGMVHQIFYTHHRQLGEVLIG